MEKKLNLSTFAKRYGTLVGLVLLCLAFSLLKPQFRTVNNILTILRQIAMLL